MTNHFHVPGPNEVPFASVNLADSPVKSIAKPSQRRTTRKYEHVRTLLETFGTPPMEIEISSAGNTPDDNGTKCGTGIQTSGDDIVVLTHISLLVCRAYDDGTYLGPPSKLPSSHVKLKDKAKCEEAAVVDTTSRRYKERSVQEYWDIDIAYPGPGPSPGDNKDSHRCEGTANQGISLRMID